MVWDDRKEVITPRIVSRILCNSFGARELKHRSPHATIDV